jgi:hypothetical protein
VCASGQTLSVSVTSDANGLVTMALPFGQWTIQLSGKTVIGSWPVASLDPSITTEIPVSVTIQ